VGTVPRSATRRISSRRIACRARAGMSAHVVHRAYLEIETARLRMLSCGPHPWRAVAPKWIGRSESTAARRLHKVALRSCASKESPLLDARAIYKLDGRPSAGTTVPANAGACSPRELGDCSARFRPPPRYSSRFPPRLRDVSDAKKRMLARHDHRGKGMPVLRGPRRQGEPTIGGGGIHRDRNEAGVDIVLLGA
jgi:hypothetical protein